MGRVILTRRKADESGHQRFCSTELATVSSQRAGAAASQLEVFLEMPLGEIWHSFET